MHISNELPESFSIILLLLALFFCISLLIGFFAAGIASFRERKRIIAAKRKTAASYPAAGVILDAKLVQDPPYVKNPLHYKYSIRYADLSGVQHRAFIGISTYAPLMYAPGQAVEVHLFQESVIVPDANAFDPARGTAGMIDCPISFRKWLDKPVDETGTVMLEHDYQELAADFDKKIQSRNTAGWIWCIVGALTVIITIAVGFALFLHF